MNKLVPTATTQRLARCLFPVTFLLVGWTTAEGVICQQREINPTATLAYGDQILARSIVVFPSPATRESST